MIPGITILIFMDRACHSGFLSAIRIWDSECHMDGHTGHGTRAIMICGDIILSTMGITTDFTMAITMVIMVIMVIICIIPITGRYITVLADQLNKTGWPQPISPLQLMAGE